MAGQNPEPRGTASHHIAAKPATATPLAATTQPHARID